LRQQLPCFISPRSRFFKRNIWITAKAYGLLPAVIAVIESPPLAAMGGESAGTSRLHQTAYMA
jgi:hypothetical protein